MLAFGIICGLVAVANAGYSSSSSTGGGLYNTNNYAGQTYGSNYPYSNQYTGFSSAGGSAGAFPYYQPFAPLPNFASPNDFQNAFQQYFNQLSALNANLYNQQLAHQAAIFNSIRNQAYAGGAGGNYGGAGPAGGSFGGASAGSGSFAGGSTGTYGGIGPSGASYGGTYGGNSYAPNYASSGGSVGPGGYQQQHASIYPANPARPNLDSRFGDNESVGVTTSQGQPGFVGISSFSSSSDINGQKHRESGTSINNNGKVTNYHTRN